MAISCLSLAQPLMVWPSQLASLREARPGQAAAICLPLLILFHSLGLLFIYVRWLVSFRRSQVRSSFFLISFILTSRPKPQDFYVWYTLPVRLFGFSFFCFASIPPVPHISCCSFVFNSCLACLSMCHAFLSLPTFVTSVSYFYLFLLSHSQPILYL